MSKTTIILSQSIEIGSTKMAALRTTVDASITRTETRKGPLFTVEVGDEPDETDIHSTLWDALEDYKGRLYGLLIGHASDREPVALPSLPHLED